VQVRRRLTIRQLSLGCVVALLFFVQAAGAGVTCSISATGVSFGAYDAAMTAPTDSTGAVDVTCAYLPPDKGASVNFAIQLSQGQAGSYVPRTLVSAAGSLSYNLYLDPARSLVWGNGLASTGVAVGKMAVGPGVGNGTRSQSFPIYGRVPPLQVVGAGTYTDSITVTIEF